jgi:hypothetical protein
MNITITRSVLSVNFYTEVLGADVMEFRIAKIGLPANTPQDRQGFR